MASVLDRDSQIESAEPYLSLVVTARNDDHGGNLLGRMQIFVDGWLAQARRYKIPSELIIVEWNPPADRPPLAEALKWPADTGPCVVRFIEVSREIHSRFKHAESLALYQMIGKNVGIRRARGRFVLATNIDILFSDELAAFIGEQKLRTDRMYRIDRHDAMSDVPAGAPIGEQLEYCRNHLIRVNRREGTFEVSPVGNPVLSSIDAASPSSGILFGSGWFTPERFETVGCFRWAHREAEILLDTSPESLTHLTADLEPGPATGGRPLDLEVLTDDGRSIARVSIDTRTHLQLMIPAPPPRRLIFRAVGAHASPNTNPRTLCFRVFRLERERAGQLPNVEIRKAQATLEPQSKGRRILLAWKKLQYVIRKLAEGGPLVSLTVPVSPRLQRMLKNYVRRGGFTGMIRRDRRMEEPAILPASTIPAGPAIESVTCPDFLHTNGCGDFTLIAREHWLNLRGYPEFDVFSMNLDSVFCFAAHYGGAREEVLTEPMRIYHIEHGSGSGWTPEGQKNLFERITAKGIPILDNEDVLQWGAQMRRLDSPMIFNRESWGLAEFELEETAPETGTYGTGESGQLASAAIVAGPSNGHASRSEESAEALDTLRQHIMPRYHPAFDLLSPYAGPPDFGFGIDFLGVKTRCEFLGGAAVAGMPGQPDPPNEEYFEWIDLLESIMAAKEHYTMMELGAGYGRWSVRAAAAVRQLRKLPFHLVAVEGEPRHYRWLQQHMADNQITPDECTLVQGVVSDHRNDVLFYVGSPTGGSDEAASWYGQAITKEYEAVDTSNGNYEGQDVFRLKSGWTSIKTRSYLLTDILPAKDRIDLIDLDVQGEELKIISEAIKSLDQRVTRLHIGTHARDIEKGLRRLLTRHGWECKADYPCAQTNQTPWGPVAFVDGVQSWINSRLT